MTVELPVVQIPGFDGTQLRRGDDGYDTARRVFNGMIDRYPEVIAQCGTERDVAAAVRFARDQSLPLSVYGGGHNVTGSAVIDGAVCVDLRGLRDLVVDPDARTVDAGGGCTWGELDEATQLHGLAVTGGRVARTGIGGLSLGSGSGWLERYLGFTCDNLLEADVVVADGRIVRASEDENPDLFWALRGGGGNFGIVTRFRFRLHQVGPMIFGGMISHPPSAAGELLRRYRDFMASAPNEVGGGVAFTCVPPVPEIPETAWGSPMVGLLVSYAGDPDEGAQVLAPLLEFGRPMMSRTGPMPYLALQGMLGPSNPWGMRNYWSGDFLDELPDEAIDALVPLATAPVSPLTQLIVIPGGGAIADVAEGATAFSGRQAAFNLHYLSMWSDPADDDLNIEYTRRVAAAVKPWTTGRVYLNFIGDEGQQRVDDAFAPAVLARLRELKRIWDPDNLFRHNQNIRPATA